MSRSHGTVSCYKRGCRCSDCVGAERAYCSERRRRIAYGRPTTDLIDATPARAHAFRLLDLGWGRREIEAVTGGDISAVLYGRPSEGLPPLRRISELTSRRIQQIPLELIASDKRIPADGSRRRAQALCLLGHTVTWQAEEAGVRRMVVSLLVNGDSGSIQARHAVAIRDLHAKWWSRPAAAGRATTRVRNLAVKKGFLPTLAWDDDLIDLPEADLDAELGRRVEAMDLAELSRCYRAHFEQGDRSPLIVAGAKALSDRRRVRARELEAAA
ncbi:hypothetical protein [Nocardiopsis eucommiae]|uniref:hypothetical protein n=1 Tax=Nocardiopsis eucommiae TaxID=2831970 RepID=UPI003D74FC06